ncbi:MAG: hypothetical protein Q8O99_06620 [bacterium]|nr:hypothetical protein [bacterium]
MKKYVGRITADPSQLHKVGSQDLSRLYALRQEIKAKLKTLFPHPKLQALLL